MTKPIFSIITPVFNNWEMTKQYLESLHKYTPQGISEIIIINNASTDDTSGSLDNLGKSLFGDYFTVMHMDRNINFGPASNLGAKHAKADILLFLNNDTLMTKDWYKPLLEQVAQTKRLGAVGPLLLYPDDTVQHLGVVFSPQSIAHLYANFPKNHPVVNKPRHLQAITGAAMMMPKQIFWQAGGFYEEYVNGFEDVDLCYSITKLGLKLICEPKSIIYHLESQSVGRHNNNKSNSAIINSRVGDKCFIDCHHQAFKDGFEIALSYEYELCIVETAEKSRELLEQAKSLSLQEVYQLCKNNPIWLEGFLYLAEELEKQGDFSGACGALGFACKIKPSMEIYSTLARLAQLAQSASTLALAQKLMNKSIEKKANSLLLLKLILKRAYAHNDSYLIDLYEKELVKLKNRI